MHTDVLSVIFQVPGDLQKPFQIAGTVLLPLLTLCAVYDIWQGCLSHGRIQDFERVGAPRGGCRISGSQGDDGGAEGPERSAGAPRGVRFGEGRRSPSQDEVWGHSPGKFLKFNSQSVHFDAFCGCLRR